MTNNTNLNLVIDFNNMAFRALFTCTYSTEYNVTTFDTDRECEILVRKIAMDMSYVIRMFNPNRVIIACDTKKSWRNELYKDIPGETYKGNRVKDAAKNWSKIYAALDDFKLILRNKGFIVTEIDNAEADDLAALWKNNIFDNKESVIFVSSDKDWSQLIEFKKDTEQFCASFNPISNNKGRRKLYICNDIQYWLDMKQDPSDIFFTHYNPLKLTLTGACDKDDKLDIESISPDNILLEKIICGDDGDNVPGFYDFYKNGKKWRITPLRMQKIFESSNISNMLTLKEHCADNSILESITNVSKHTVDDINASDRLMRQRKLVELNLNLFPQKIIDDFMKHVEKTKDKGYINTADINMETMLSGTKYIDKNFKKSLDNGIFKELKDLDYLIGKSVNTLV